MAHGVLPLHYRNDAHHAYRYRRKAFFSPQQSWWSRLGQSLLSRWARRTLMALALVLVVYRLSTHMSASTPSVAVEVSQQKITRLRRFDLSKLRAAGVTNLPREAKVDAGGPHQQVPVPNQWDAPTAQSVADKPLVQIEEVLPGKGAPPEAIKILDDDNGEVPPTPGRGQVEKRWALEGADGSGETALRSAIRNLVREMPVVIFSKTTCPYSRAVKALFAAKGLSEVPFVVEANLRADMAEFKQTLVGLTGHATFPNVFVRAVVKLAWFLMRPQVGGKHLGGSDTVHALDKGGELDTMLASAGVLLFAEP